MKKEKIGEKRILKASQEVRHAGGMSQDLLKIYLQKVYRSCKEVGSFDQGEKMSYNLNSFCKQGLLKQHSRNMKVHFHFHSLVQVKKSLV